MASWFYKIDDVEHGPITQEELVKMVQHGRLKPTDLIRIDTKEKWYKARDVKGLEFPGDNGQEDRPGKKSSSSESAATATSTSAEARNLLKGFGRANKNKGSTETSTVRTTTDAPDAWEQRQKANTRAVMTRGEKKPLDPFTKKIMFVAGGLLLLLILFPPHQPPEGLSLAPSMEGRHRFLFTPPVMKLDAEKSSMGNVDIDNLRTEDGKTFVLSDMPINGFRLFMEGLVIIVIAAATIGLLAAKKAAGEVPEPAPTHPPKRRAV